MWRLRFVMGPVFLAALLTGTAFRNEIFNFTGDCDDCTGTGAGVLTLDDSYVVGNEFTTTEFISFFYTSNLTDWEFDSGDIYLYVDGTLPVGLGRANVDIGDNELEFVSYTDGSWAIGDLDEGINGTWSAASTSVPEPSAWLPILFALLAGHRFRSRTRRTG
jgi:hypothetical protein